MKICHEIEKLRCFAYIHCSLSHICEWMWDMLGQ